jgi:predicted HTH domain antitoxin
MTIEIEDRICTNAHLTEKTLLLKFAVMLFQEECVTLAQASELAQLHQIQFQKELAKRKIPIHYGENELMNDLKTIAFL